MMDKPPLLPSPSVPPPRRGPIRLRTWVIGCGSVVLVTVIALFAVIAYGFTHGDAIPYSPPQDIKSETFSQAPVIAQAGTGSTVPTHLVFRTSAPHDSRLMVEFHSAYFLWVPSGATPAVPSSQRGSTGWYTLGRAGQETLQWTLIAQSPTAAPGTGTHTEIPGADCPAQLPIPLTTAVQNCVVATATVYVGVS